MWHTVSPGIHDFWTHYVTLSEEEKKTQGEQWLVIRRNLLSFIFLTLFPLITFLLAFEVEHKKLIYLPQLQIGLYRQPPRSQRAASLGGGEGQLPWEICPGSWTFLGALIQFPLGRVSDTEPSGFSEPEWLWGRRGSLCLPALMCAEVTTSRIQTGTHDPSFLFSEKHRFWTTVKSLIQILYCDRTGYTKTIIFKL